MLSYAVIRYELLDMDLAGVSVRRVEDIIEALWVRFASIKRGADPSLFNHLRSRMRILSIM